MRALMIWKNGDNIKVMTMNQGEGVKKYRRAYGGCLGSYRR